MSKKNCSKNWPLPSFYLYLFAQDKVEHIGTCSMRVESQDEFLKLLEILVISWLAKLSVQSKVTETYISKITKLALVSSPINYFVIQSQNSVCSFNILDVFVYHYLNNSPFEKEWSSDSRPKKISLDALLYTSGLVVSFFRPPQWISRHTSSPDRTNIRNTDDVWIMNRARNWFEFFLK